MNIKDYSLVLSGGGALGYAHLGILFDLEEQKFEKPSEIIGTSMGAIIGAAYACGKTPSEIHKTLKEASQWKNWIRLSFKKKGMFSHRKILAQLNEEFQGAMMNEVEIPLKIIATNKVTGEKRVFDEKDGDISVADAVVASMALPTIFPDKTINGSTYIDGCYSSNCGILEATKNDVIISNVLGKRSFDSPKRNDLERSLRIMIANQSEQELNACTASGIHYFDVETRHYGTFQFHKIDEITQLGRNLIYQLNS